MRKIIDYGQDAPDVLNGYLLRGLWFLLAGKMLSRRRSIWAGRIFLGTGWFWIARGMIMIWSSRVIKVWAADRLLDEVNLRGNEIVLDVGCGRGLLLIKAAKRLPSGRAVGIDLWSQVDQGANTKKATLTNAQIEGVADRVEVHDGDMCDLSFLPDGSIDVIVACKSIHNVPTWEGRRQAVEEIVRVLKPGGRVALMDIFLIEELAEHLQACGMQTRISPPNFLAYPPLRWLVSEGREL